MNEQIPGNSRPCYTEYRPSEAAAQKGKSSIWVGAVMQIPPVNKVKVLALNQQTDKAGRSCMHVTKNWFQSAFMSLT